MNGAAEPVGGITPGTSATAGTPSSSPSASPSPSAAVTSASPQTSKTGKPATTLHLGPYGVGDLKLGMSQAAAVKTGLLVKDPEPDTTGCSTVYYVKTDETHSPVIFEGSKGLMSITAYPGLTTPAGIKLGSTFKAVRKAYPDWENPVDGGDTGKGFAQVPGSDNAVYQIEIEAGKVDYLSLEFRRDSCSD
ncbi:hypothetical protein [Actinoplanes awajinensis]|uniref:Uncharacterized protein n=1 Tax=Actinoplanes awajinensis subsp. mycoplanecinus TaxID=135947 RepID=A0A0X3V6V0_9ACTN|nr:hypothetical protein [Actinoplanes awajinensis]KUL38976.1 hypothetical protein ADL15_10255 [Actinoplanes awajinensis subsp. mycoplanecinus]